MLNELLNNILMLLFSLAGIIFGLALTYIAPEELAAGKKYFILSKRLLFVMISLVIIYYLSVGAQVQYLLLFTALLSSAFIFDFKTKRRGHYGFHYLFFVLPYFLIMDQTFHLILASLIFLYGLPVGSLLRSG